jgi:hypothetical protein
LAGEALSIQLKDFVGGEIRFDAAEETLAAAGCLSEQPFPAQSRIAA